jgi:hypothetical protein
MPSKICEEASVLLGVSLGVLMFTDIKIQINCPSFLCYFGSLPGASTIRHLRFFAENLVRYSRVCN